MTKAQQVYERVEALVAEGEKKADAFRRVADELGQPFNSVRGAYYSHTRSLGGTPGTGIRRKPPADPVERAVALLQQAIEAIDEDIADAKAIAEQADARYKELRDSAASRKADIAAKIKALTGKGQTAK